MNEHKSDHSGPEHVSRAKDPKIVEESQGVFGIIRAFFGFLAIVIGVLLLANHCSAERRVAKEEKAQADSVEATKKTVPIIYKVGKEKTLYHFDEGKKGCISAYLGSDAEFYPKGGSVIITPPQGSGKSWEDEPGTVHQREPVNPGTFTVCRKSPNAWGVEIWQ